MPRDGSGNYTLPAGNPVVPSTIIATNWANTTLSDIATALTQSLSIDGSVTTAKIADDAVTPPKLAGLDADGMVARISATEFEARTITGTANKITVTNGDGVAGAPTLTIPDAVTLVTPTITGLVTLTGGQIKFPATQSASADANTLDDYEEGTWTPAITFDTPGNLNVAYSFTTGTYVKIGFEVVIFFSIETTTFTHTTASGSMRITGVPFAAAAAHEFGGAVWKAEGITLSTSDQISLGITAGSTSILYLANNVVAGTTGGFGPAAAPTGVQKKLFGSVTYHV